MQTDDIGQVTTSFQEHGGAVNTLATPKVHYGYADGLENTVRPTSLTYSDGRVLTYSYSGTANDRASRVDAIQDGAQTLPEYSDRGRGSVVEVDYHEADVRYTTHAVFGDRYRRLPSVPGVPGIVKRLDLLEAECPRRPSALARMLL
jgi:hypothetical protein